MRAVTPPPPDMPHDKVARLVFLLRHGDERKVKEMCQRLETQDRRAKQVTEELTKVRRHSTEVAAALDARNLSALDT